MYCGSEILLSRHSETPIMSVRARGDQQFYQRMPYTTLTVIRPNAYERRMQDQYLRNLQKEQKKDISDKLAS